MDEDTLELEDGSVSMLGAVRLPHAAVPKTLAPEQAASALARAYFVQTLGDAGRHVELTDRVVAQDGNGWTVYLAQTVDGVPIAGTYAMATVRGNTLTYAHHFLVQAPALDTVPQISASAAEQVAVDALSNAAYRAAIVGGASSTLTIVFHDGQGKLAWNVPVETQGPPQTQAVYVDAQTGAFLSAENLTQDMVSGHVNFAVEMDCAGDTPVEMPVPHIKWNGRDYTDDGGAFASETNIATARVSLESPYFRVKNWQGVLAGPWVAPLVADGDNDVVVRDQRLAQLDAFYHLHVVRQWVRDNAPGSTSQTRWTETQVPVNVNYDRDICNAWYSGGTLTFFAASGGCLNTARSANIVYHEFGHGIHHHSAPAAAGLRIDRQLGEGVGDYVASTITGNPRMHGIGGCHDNFRSANNHLTFCARGCDRAPPSAACRANSARPGCSREEEHAAGQVIAGAWWDLRGLLAQRYGEKAGVATSDRLFLRFLNKVTTMSSAYQAAIAADDDTDNNPANGTVHSCDINRAFADDAPGSVARFPEMKTHLVPCVAP